MFSISNESRLTKIAVVAVLAVFLFACIFASFYYNDKLLLGSFEKFNNDDVKYLRSAQTLLDTGKFTYRFPDKPTVFIMPGITFILTPFVAIFGMEGAVMPVRIFFALLQTFNLYLVFLIARKIFNTKVAFISLIISVLYLPNVYVTTIILTEPVMYTCFLLLIHIVIWGTEKKEKKYFIIGGIIWGLSVMFRPTMGAFPILVFLYWLFKKFKFKDIVKFAVCAIIPFMIVMSPWIIRNYITFNKFIPLTLSSGNPKFLGSIIDFSMDERKRMFTIIGQDESNMGDDEITMDENYHKLANKVIDYNLKNNTGEYIKWYTVGKTVKNFKLPYMWYPIYMNNTYEPMNHFHTGLLYIFAAGSILMLIKRKVSPETGLLLVTVVFFNCVHLPFYCFPRYVYPVMSLVTIIDSYLIYKALGIVLGGKIEKIIYEKTDKEKDLKKLIIIPAYNEEENILNTINTIKEYPDYDYIVINDGSVDSTEKILKENNIHHVTLIKNLGIGGAMQTGYKYALQNEYDVAIQLDADGQHNPEYLDRLTKTLVETESDMVIGSRYIEKEGFQSTASRRLGKNILTGLIKILTGTRITDPTSGFRACSKNTIRLFANEYPVDYPEPETVVELLAMKNRVTEIPVIMNEREGGVSSITPVKSVYYMVKVSIAIFFSYINNRKRRCEK